MRIEWETIRTSRCGGGDVSTMVAAVRLPRLVGTMAFVLALFLFRSYQNRDVLGLWSYAYVVVLVSGLALLILCVVLSLRSLRRGLHPSAAARVLDIAILCWVDQKTLLPDTEALLEATRTLVKDGFVVMPYTNDDPIMAKKLEDAGAVCVMPLAAPIGSGQGIVNPLNIRFILEAVSVPVIVDAGVGTASDAAVAMEFGIDGLLMNTAIAEARDPVKMAQAMRYAVEAGRLAFEAGRIPKKLYAGASSPTTGLVRPPAVQPEVGVSR